MRTLALALIASGCWASCHPRDACLRFDPASAVAFIGVAGQVTLLSPEAFQGRARVTFRVSEILHGLPRGTREVVVPVEQWPSETPKETLIVQAVRRNGEVYVDGGCETTIYSLGGRPEDVDYYRQVRDGTYRSALKVIVTSVWGAGAGAQVRLTRPGLERTALVPEWNVAEIKDLTPGKYRLTTRQSGYLPPPDQEVTITANHCAEARVSLTGGGSVAGRALDARGMAIPGLVVDLTKEGGAGRETRTDAAGRFHFGAVPPGQYALGTNRNVAIGSETLEQRILAPRCQQAGNIAVNAFQNVTGVAFRCPGLGVVRLIRVRVIDRTGRPVPGAEVRSPEGSYLSTDPSQITIFSFATDAQGWARITVMDGAWLEIQAVASDGRKSQVVKVAQRTGSQVLTVGL